MHEGGLVNSTTKYVIRTDIKFEAMEKIDVDALQKACAHDWFNQTLCKVNDSLVRLGIFKGEFHWHRGTLGTVLDFVTLSESLKETIWGTLGTVLDFVTLSESLKETI
jgi:hypothetical protein